MGTFREIAGWVIFVVTTILLIPVTIVACGLAPRSVRNGWDEQANKISGLEDDK